MANKNNFTEEHLKQKGFVEKDGVFEKSKGIGDKSYNLPIIKIDPSISHIDDTGIYIKTSKFPGKVRNSPDIVKNEFPVPIYDEPTIYINPNLAINNAKPIAVFDVVPIGAPRMTQRDRFYLDPTHKDPKKRQRKSVALYWKYKSELILQAKRQNFTVPESEFHVIFYIPMPHSWPEKKKSLMDMTPHQQKPDIDNLCKGLFDSLLADDSFVWDVRTTKYWSRFGKILIYKQ